MTVTSTVASITYDGAGSAGPFPVPFYFLNNADILATLRNADNSETTLVLSSDYTLTGAGNEAGGSLTLMVVLASGQTLVIERDPVIEQQSNFTRNDPFPAQAVNDALDRLTMIDQQQQLQLDRSMLFPRTSGITGQEWPLPVDGKFLYWSAGKLSNADAVYDLGNFLQGGTGTITRTALAKMQDVVNIRDFAGCDPTGATASDAAFASARLRCIALGGLKVYLGPGIFTLATTQALCTGLIYIGDGHEATMIKLANSANCDALQSDGFAGHTGSTDWYVGADSVPHSFGLVGLTVNGNYANNSSGSGVKFFGKRYIIDDVQVVNCAEYGFWSECGNVTGQTDPYNDMPEAYIGKLWVRNCGKDGFHWEGPHDSRIDSVIASHCGQNCINFNKGTHSGPTCDVGFMHGYGSGQNAAGAYLYDYAAVRINATIRCGEVIAESAAGNALLIGVSGLDSQFGIVRAFLNGQFSGAASKVCVVVNADNVLMANASIDDAVGGGGLQLGPSSIGGNFFQCASLRATGTGAGIGLDVDSSGNTITGTVSSFSAGTGLRTGYTTLRNNNNLTLFITGNQLSWNNVAAGNANRYMLNIVTPTASTVTGHFTGVGPHDSGAVGNDWSVVAALANGSGYRYSKFTGITASTFALDTTGRQALAIAHNALNGLTPTIGMCSLVNTGTGTQTVKNGPNIESFDSANINFALNLSGAGTAAATANVGYSWAL